VIYNEIKRTTDLQAPKSEPLRLTNPSSTNELQIYG
jgi:hypothetical protein